MIDQFEAFDILFDKVKYRERFTGTLIAIAACGCVPTYYKIEAWVASKGYICVLKDRKIFYYFSAHVVTVNWSKRLAVV